MKYLLAGWLAALLVSSGAHAQTSVTLSADITVDLDGLVFADEGVAVDDLMGSTVPGSLGALPEGAAVTAYDLLSNGDQLFALDMAAELAGSQVVERRDVVRYDGLGYALEFDGSAEGIPDNASVDAVSRTGAGDLLLSFDITVDLAAGLTAADEDLIRWDGATFSLFFDGSAQGIGANLDLDGAQDLGGGAAALSFDGSGSVGGVTFDDEDVLSFDPNGPIWTRVYDGSVEHTELASADLEAIRLPEPAQPWLLASGFALLLVLARSRVRS